MSTDETIRGEVAPKGRSDSLRGDDRHIDRLEQ
jgi:hypothetical protein